MAKPCARCNITTINQLTGEREGKEPLQTLATYRMQARDTKNLNKEPFFGTSRDERKLFFGWNAIHDHQEGSMLTLRVGDILEAHPR